MATVLVAPEALRELDRLTAVLSLPADTRGRFRHSLEPLAAFPLVGNPVEERGRWRDYRVVLGPWPWMLVLYTYDETTDVVGVATVQDARSSTSVRSTSR